MLHIIRSARQIIIPAATRTSAARAMSDDGAIKKEGGKLAKKAAADENQYIRQMEREQWIDLKKHHEEEIHEHHEDIKRLQKRIDEHKAKLETIEKHSK